MSTNETIELYAGLITKPTLTEQLLSRPPFKFIVDIVTNVIKSTGYLKDDFDKDELAAAGTDKNAKQAFLDKLIGLLDSGDLGNVKSAKIIAGKDPEETNKLLQKLATNARNSSGGEKEKKKKSKDKDKDKEKDKEKRSSSKEKSSERKSKRDSISASSDDKKKEKRDKSKSKDEKEKSSKKSSSSKERHKSKEKKSEEKSKTEKKKKEKSLKRGDSMIAVNGDAPFTRDAVEPQDEGYDEQEGPSSNVMLINDTPDLHPVHQAVSPVKTDDSGMGDDSPRPPPPSERAALLRQATGAARPQTSMGRPGTAASRPAPPKIKKKQIATIDTTPQPVIELKSEIITDSQTAKDDNDDNFVMEEDELVDMPTLTTETVDEEDRGALVQKIMEKKAELEDGASSNQNFDDGNETTAVEREKVRQLQEKLQDLTKTAYPLARLFDFANDDIETMIKELERWRLEQRKNEVDEQNRKAAGLGDSSRLYEMVANLQRDIKDIKEELSAARGRVLANDDRIKLLVSNI